MGFLELWTGSNRGAPVTRANPIPTYLADAPASDPSGGGTVAEAVTVGGLAATVTATFNRPADTTAYASGDLLANSTTAGSVVPMTLALGRKATGYGASSMIRRLRLRKSGTSITNAAFRVHLYRASPTPSNGDNGAFLTNQAANYIGAVDVTMNQAFTDGAGGNGVPNIGSEINLSVQTVFALVEVRAAYTPISAETFTLEIEVLRN